MTLSETYDIKRKQKTEELYKTVDACCYRAKNLYNSVNYLIRQCDRISCKLKQGEVLDSFEKAFLYRINCGIKEYNEGRGGKRKGDARSAKGAEKSGAERSGEDGNGQDVNLGENVNNQDVTPGGNGETLDKKNRKTYIGRESGNIVDPYFLSWYLKGTEEFRAVGYSTCSQVVIQDACRNWKAFYSSLNTWKTRPGAMPGYPRKPGYYDKHTGRHWLTLTAQNVGVEADGRIRMPKFLKGLHLHTDKKIRQVRIKTTPTRIRVQILYDREAGTARRDAGRVMGVDLGMNNLMAAVSNTEMAPFIIKGKKLKSINQYYNKKKSMLQGIAKRENGLAGTKRLDRLSEVRNNKVKDYLHKASRLLVDRAVENDIGLIVVGKNMDWGQEAGSVRNAGCLGLRGDAAGISGDGSVPDGAGADGRDRAGRKRTGFASIPFAMLVRMISYKAALEGIKVLVVDEGYTSGTSYLDGEPPEKEYYNRERRIKRGLFRSDTGLCINADVNAGYQILKKGDVPVPVKGLERVETIRVA